MKFCGEQGCPDIALTGDFCKLHADAVNRTDRHAARHERDAWYTRKEWRGKFGVRGMKLRRNTFCEIEGCKNRATQVHHLDKSWKERGDWTAFLGGVDMQGLQSLCGSCHARISMQELMQGPKKEEEQLCQVDLKLQG